MEDIIVVGMADFKIAKGKQCLTTRDLGSCVGIAIRDTEKKIAGLLHIMLPYNLAEQDVNKYPKYADTGIPFMVNQMCKAGADRTKLVAKLAGAAHMFKSPGIPEAEDISSRNIMAVREILTNMSIPILAEEVEDYIPRTVIFEPETGIYIIKTVGRTDRII